MDSVGTLRARLQGVQRALGLFHLHRKEEIEHLYAHFVVQKGFLLYCLHFCCFCF